MLGNAVKQQTPQVQQFHKFVVFTVYMLIFSMYDADQGGKSWVQDVLSQVVWNGTGGEGGYQHNTARDGRSVLRCRPACAPQEGHGEERSDLECVHLVQS